MPPAPGPRARWSLALRTPREVPLLSAPIQGMRGAVASTLRNMYVQSAVAKTVPGPIGAASLDARWQAFIQAGGIPRLVQLLNRDMGDSDFALEGILNMDDLVETDTGSVDPKMVQAHAVPYTQYANHTRTYFILLRTMI